MITAFSKKIDMSWMFNGMNNLTSLDASNFDTSNVTDMTGMFAGNINFSTINYSNDFIHKGSATTNNMYTNCPANKPTHESWNEVF